MGRDAAGSAGSPSDSPADSHCRDCATGRAHCHGTLIRHPAGQCQCTEPGCEHAELFLHSLTIDCDALGCCCGDEYPAHQRREAV